MGTGAGGDPAPVPTVIPVLRMWRLARRAAAGYGGLTCRGAPMPISTFRPLALPFPVLAALVLGGCGLLGDDEPPPPAPLPPPQVVKEQLTEAELVEICKELMEDGTTKAQKAQARVEELSTELAEKEARLAEFEAKELADEKKRAAAAEKWKAMKAEVEELRSKLGSAEAERDQVRTELKVALRELDKQIAETNKFKAKAKEYKEQSTTNLWSSFQNGAKVEICDRGTKRRHEKCHEAVEAALTPAIQEKFKLCVDNYQATPLLKQLEKGEAMPQHAVTLADDNKFTKKGWIIVFCDPTLPEARDRDLDDVAPAGRDVRSEDAEEAAP